MDFPSIITFPLCARSVRSALQKETKIVYFHRSLKRFLELEVKGGKTSHGLHLGEEKRTNCMQSMNCKLPA